MTWVLGFYTQSGDKAIPGRFSPTMGGFVGYRWVKPAVCYNGVMLSDKKIKAMHKAVRLLKDKGVEIPPEYIQELNATLDQTPVEMLAQLAQGLGTDVQVRYVVSHHWPEVLLDDWQVTLIRYILSGQGSNLNQVLIKGCTAAGKGFAVATAACLWYQASDDCKVIITSQRHKHAHDVMYAEVLRCRKNMCHACDGDNGDTRIKTNEKKYIATASPESGEGFSGQHGPATLFIYDESTSVPEEYWDLGKTQAACMVALANPRTMSGWFRHAFPEHAIDKTQEIEIPGGRRYVVTIGGSDCLNVKTGEQKIPNQITRERYLAIMAHPNPRWSRVFGDAKFPEEDEDILIVAPSWLDRHLKAWRADIHVDAFGLDVAASEHGDRTILTSGGTAGCLAVHELQDVDTMRVVAWTIKTAEKYDIHLKSGGIPIVVDMDGLGKGVGDRLAELGCWVIEFRGNATSDADPKQYANLRAEGYGELGRRLDPRGAWPDEPWALPHDNEMCEDLCAPEKLYSSDGVKFKLTPKDKPVSGYRGETIRQKLGRSPDRGDSVVYLYHGVRIYEQGIDWRHRWKDDIVASGEDPVDERTPLTDAEIEELPDFLKDFVEGARLQEQDRNAWTDAERFEEDDVWK